MSVSIFHLKNVEPDEKMLATALNTTKIHFDSITRFIENEYGEINFEWKFYNQKAGWILKIINKKRNILFIIPCSGYFRVSFTLGDKAVDKVVEGNFPDSVKNEFLEARKYAEGRTIQIDVRNDEDGKIIPELVRVKLRM
jgi:hypoxanthine phosphoribosyltransferase